MIELTFQQFENEHVEEFSRARPHQVAVDEFGVRRKVRDAVGALAARLFVRGGMSRFGTAGSTN